MPGRKYFIIFDTNFFITLKKIYRKNALEILSTITKAWTRKNYQIGTTNMVLMELKDSSMCDHIRKKMELVDAKPYDVDLVKKNVSRHSGRKNYTKGGKKTDYELIALSRQEKYLIVTTDQGIRNDKYVGKGKVMGVSTFALESFNRTKNVTFRTLSRDFFLHRMKNLFTGNQSVFSEYVITLYDSIRPGQVTASSNESKIVNQIIEGKSTTRSANISPELVKLAEEVKEGIDDTNMFFEKVRLYGITAGTKAILAHLKSDIVEQAEQSWYWPVIAIDCYNNLASIFSYEENRKSLERAYILRAIVLAAIGRIKEAGTLSHLVENKDPMTVNLKNIINFLEDKEVKTMNGFQDFSQLFTTYKRWRVVKKLTEYMLLNGEVSDETKEMYSLAISMRLEQPPKELQQLIGYKDYTKKAMPFKSKTPVLIEETKYGFLHEVMPIITYYDDLEQGKRIIIARCPKLSANLGIYMEDKSARLNQMESLQFITGHIKISSYVGPLRIRGKITVLEGAKIDWHESNIQLPDLA